MEESVGGSKRRGVTASVRESSSGMTTKYDLEEPVTVNPLLPGAKVVCKEPANLNIFLEKITYNISAENAGLFLKR